MRNRKRISQFPADVDADSSAFSINLPSPEGLTDNQVKALELLAVWKKQTPDEFCAEATFKAIEQEFIELRAAAGGEVEKPSEKEWAAKFFDRVESLMDLPEEEMQTARRVHGLPSRESGDGGTANPAPSGLEPCKGPLVILLAITQELNEQIEQHTGRLNESLHEFVIGAIRQRLQFLTAGMDPKTAGPRALNRALEVMGRNGFNRLMGVRTLAHQICGPAFYARLEPLAHSCGMTPEEMLLLVMARKYKVDASWVMPDAERIAQTGIIAHEQNNGGGK